MSLTSIMLGSTSLKRTTEELTFAVLPGLIPCLLGAVFVAVGGFVGLLGYSMIETQTGAAAKIVVTLFFGVLSLSFCWGGSRAFLAGGWRLNSERHELTVLHGYFVAVAKANYRVVERNQFQIVENRVGAVMARQDWALVFIDASGKQIVLDRSTNQAAMQPILTEIQRTL